MAELNFNDEEEPLVHKFWETHQVCQRGAIQGAVTYELTPTTIVNILRIRCSCGGKLDVTSELMTSFLASMDTRRRKKKDLKMTTSYEITNGYHLINQQFDNVENKTVVVEKPVHNVLVLDCSGSMAYDLPKLREQCKKRLRTLLKEHDLLTIIWFSSRNEFGVLFEAEPIATLKDLKDVETAIDRWLRPIGLTGFKQPLEEVAKVVSRMKNKDMAVSLFFMSDGCDNQWGRADILKAVEQLSPIVHSAVFVEYGYYADRNLLSAMAEKCGGVNIFAADFAQYEPMFEAAMQKKPTGVPKVEVSVDPSAEGFAFAIEGKEIRTFAIEGGKINVPKDLKSVWYLSTKSIGETGPTLSKAAGAIVSGDAAALNSQSSTALYAAMALYSQRMNSNVVYALLKASGDVRFINKFANCFGKQKYSDFIDTVSAAAWTPTLRLVDGFNPDKVPNEDAFTLLDLLKILAADEDNKVLLNKPEFCYSKIGRGRINSDLVLTEEEQKEIQELTAKMAKTKDSKKVAELSAKIASITSTKQPLKFEEAVPPHGYSLQALTYNEARPNISILVQKAGTVDLSARLDTSKFDKVPVNFETKQFRNYAIIKDGLVNVDTLPVKLTNETLDLLQTNGLLIEAKEDYQVLHLNDLPIINRNMVRNLDPKTLFSKAYELTKAQAVAKVYKGVLGEVRTVSKSLGFVEKYGAEATEWLKEQGITEFSGFAPKAVQAESTDVYMGKELKISLKGLSSLPSLKEVREKMAKGKLTPSAALMAPTITLVDEYRGKHSAEAFEQWLTVQAKIATDTVRGLLADMAKINFIIVVGQTWPFPTLEENQYTLVEDGVTVECKIEQKEIEIKI